MRNYFLFVLLITCLLSCSRNTEHGLDENSFYYQLNQLSNEELQENYSLLRNRIEQKIKQSGNLNNEEIKIYLNTVLCDSIFHYWYNTDWDFNGTTQKPRQGSIACGYFVTTTLLHCGFDLNRVKIAQQSASKIIRTLCKKESIKSFYNKNYKGLKNYLRSSADGLYLIGLDNHVGFIQKKDTSLVMIHSGVNTGVVCRERLDDCKPVRRSKVHVIGNLLENEMLLNSWKKKTRIELVN